MPSLLPPISKETREKFLEQGYNFHTDKPLPDSLNPYTTEGRFITGAIVATSLFYRQKSLRAGGPTLQYSFAAVSALFFHLMSMQKLAARNDGLGARTVKPSIARQGFEKAMQQIEEENNLLTIQRDRLLRLLEVKNKAQ